MVSLNELRLAPGASKPEKYPNKGDLLRLLAQIKNDSVLFRLCSLLLISGKIIAS
jgi:hypothetical protein